MFANDDGASTCCKAYSMLAVGTIASIVFSLHYNYFRKLALACTRLQHHVANT